jgi:tryptophan halogenase
MSPSVKTRHSGDNVKMKIPETLKHRIELFKESGRIFQKNNDIFAENSWSQVMLGQGYA